MPAIYAASDVLVLPSEHETWGLVANEALACGKPIVLADTVGSAPDLAADGSAGRVYPAGNILSLADNILDVLNAPPSREMIAAKSEKYSIVAAADGMCDALDALQDVSGNHAR
jgi:glycosyltransferase involved in cell wall biosynthesis